MTSKTIPLHRALSAGSKSLWGLCVFVSKFSTSSIVFVPVIVTVLCQQRFLGVVFWIGPFPASSDAGERAVHAGQDDQKLEHQHHRRHHETEDVAWRSVPFIGGGREESAPAIQVCV